MLRGVDLCRPWAPLPLAVGASPALLTVLPVAAALLPQPWKPPPQGLALVPRPSPSPALQDPAPLTVLAILTTVLAVLYHL